MTHGSLFAGIGGFDLGFERAGLETVWQVEIDEYCRRVLAKHFPDAARFCDVRECSSANLERVDVITGGFPCQDVSKAGNRAGIDYGTRSGLWFEMRRIVCELRPKYVVVENVTGLLESGIGIVLRDLAACGYDAEWDCLPAAAFGAPHLRDRTFIVAYPNGERPLHGETGRFAAETGVQAFGDSGASGPTRKIRGEAERYGWPFSDFKWVREPEIQRVVDGVPDELDKADIRGFGNTLLPQVAEWIGKRLMVLSGERDQKERQEIGERNEADSSE